MAKTHFAHVERGNESNPHDDWGTTACGMTEYESPVTDELEYVTCTKCIRIVNASRSKRSTKQEGVYDGW